MPSSRFPRLAATVLFLMGLGTLPVFPLSGQETDEEQGAQPAPPPGFVALTGGLLDQFRNPAVYAELDLSDEQREKIAELVASRRSGGAAFRQLREGGADLTEEDRDRIRSEIARASQEENAEAARELQQILRDEQYSRLRQVWLQQMGLRGLLSPEVADEMELTDEQREQLQVFAAQEAGVNRGIPFGADREEVQKYQEEWRSRWTDVLTEDQKSSYEALLGPALESRQVAQASDGDEPTERGRRGNDDDQTEGNDSAPATVTPVTPPPAALPAKPAGEVVANFARKGETEDVRPGDPVSFNFDNAPWQVVLELFAERAGNELHIKDLPPGTFNYSQDPKSYTIRDALDVINGYLLQEGYTLVQRDNALVSIKYDGTDIPPNLIPEVTPAQLMERGRNEFLRVAFPVEAGVDVEKLAEEIDLITGPQGTTVGLTTANRLVVTDIGSNLRRINELLTSVSPPRTPEEPLFKAYALTYISAEDLEYYVQTTLNGVRAVPNVSAGGGGDDRGRGGFQWPGFGDRGGDRGDRGGDSRRGATQTPATPQASVTSEMRTNQLLVTATPNQHRVVEDLISAIDVDVAGEAGRVGFGSRKPYLKIYRMQRADAGEAAKTLTALMPGVVINESRRDGTIHIMANEVQHREVQANLDLLEGGGAGGAVEVIPLALKDPYTVASTLRLVFAKDGTDAPTIEPDLSGRQLIVRGTAEQIIQIRKILQGLGEDGSGTRPNAGRLPFVQIPAIGRDVDNVLEAFQQAWQSRENGARLQIIPRSNSGLIRGIRTPSERGQPFREAEEAAQPLPDATSIERPSRESAARGPAHANQYAVLLEDAAETDAAEAGDNASSAAEEEDQAGSEQTPTSVPATAKPLTIMIQGDDILVTGDPATVMEAQELMDYLISAMPVQTSWTIFTLQSGGAQEVADMIKMLLPDATVTSASPTSSSTSFFGSISGGLNSLGSGLADMTGLSSLGTGTTLTIIPHVAQNALYVSGPESRIDEVEQLLEVLDASEWPDSLRDRKPRLIEVKHAEVVDVYEQVSELYSDFLESSRGGGGRNQQNPFQMMLAAGGGGGRGGSGGGGQDQGTRLTLSVDTRTSHLLVSANESLFQEIKTYVEDIDQKALEAKKTVRIVALQHASPELVKNAVSTLMPRVTVTRGGSNNGGGQPGGFPNFRGNDNDNDRDRSGDDMRRMMEFRERMRQQQSGGNTQSVGSPFGGFGGRGDFGGRGGGDFSSRFGGGFPGGGGFGGRGGDSDRGRRGR